MANKRNLKKGINFICDNLIGECIAMALYHTEKEKVEIADDAIASVLHLHRDFISRISHPEPGMSQKKYFNVLRQNFLQGVNEVVDNIRNIG